MIHDLIVNLYGETTYTVLAFFFKLYPIWLPVISGIIFWELWMRYVRNLFFLNTETTLLEIRLPRDISKSPMAMELAVLGLHQTGGETTFVDRYWDGKVRAWSSLEIVSDGGTLHFYVWTRKSNQNIVEAQFYAQYPSIEIVEVPDYTQYVKFDPKSSRDMWGIYYILTKPDAFPIKTYIDYGLDKDPKEEFKHDQLTAVLEFMSSIKPGEQMWLQYIVRAHKKEKRNGVLVPASDWRTEAEGELKKIHEKIKKDGRNRPSPGESDTLAAIERSLGKFPYDVGIRAMYIGNGKEPLNRPTITGMRGLMRPFSSQELNAFRPKNSTDFDYPWEDFQNIRVNRMKRRILDGYKRRMFFFAPNKRGSMVLTNEELATIYHFPGQVALTPGLPRIPSKRSQAPSNLPV